MQPFVLYNSEQRKKVEFVPRVEGHIDMYVCGMTVYDYCHIGHARVMVAFDYIIRFLRSQGWSVKYVRNITDIDDKIIKRANKNRESTTALTDRFTKAMNRDAKRLGCLAPDEAPRATDYIDQMQSMIGKLVDQGTAYPASNGDVYFQVEKFAKYGRLSGRKLEDMQAGASERVDVEVEKKHPFDFVLWKHAKENEPAWASPWGKGRPGWHIECSAMSTCCLGNHFDIHGGGSDLMFPHHENEIAQSEASTGEQYVNYWMHVGFINVDGEKMSKSLGNFFTIRDVLKKFDAEVIRYFILSSHYRSPVNFSDSALQEAKNSLRSLYLIRKEMINFETKNIWKIAEYKSLSKSKKKEFNQVSSYLNNSNSFFSAFNEAMRDDFNTSKALACIFGLIKELKQIINCNEINFTVLAGYFALKADYDKMTKILNICSKHNALYVSKFLNSTTGLDKLEITEDEIKDLIQQRQDAKNAKDFVKADGIRQSLLAQGVILEDTRQGPEWRRAD